MSVRYRLQGSWPVRCAVRWLRRQKLLPLNRRTLFEAMLLLIRKMLEALVNLTVMSVRGGIFIAPYLVTIEFLALVVFLWFASIPLVMIYFEFSSAKNIRPFD